VSQQNHLQIVGHVYRCAYSSGYNWNIKGPAGFASGKGISTSGRASSEELAQVDMERALRALKGD
jgi:hypothetical protein